MVRLVTAASPMEARIIAARLGAEGIVWQFRGSVDGPLAVGPVEVLVDAEGYESARELLLTDDVESSFVDGTRAAADTRSGRDVLWLALIVALLILFAFARMAARV
jgi:Putative prokaryotic signal transducing protein